jgi:two-component system sensor histidine kinase ChvG
MTLASIDAMSSANSDRTDKVILGEDWVTTEGMTDDVARASRGKRGFMSLNRSPLARKIVVFNLMALVILVAGVLLMNPFRDSLVQLREKGLETEAGLIGSVLASGPGIDGAALDRVDPGPGAQVLLFDATGSLMGTKTGMARAGAPTNDGRTTVITNFLSFIWSGVSGLTGGQSSNSVDDPQLVARGMALSVISGGQAISAAFEGVDGNAFAVAVPVNTGAGVQAALVLISAQGEIDHLVRWEREEVLQIFVIALLASIGLSLVLASTIANPLADLARAAELGRDRNARKMPPGRVRIPDLTGRPDEIGRLSIAMRGMVAALYDRIESNEQFAADVSHEIKNPLASLRSAIGSLRIIKKEEHREKLLDVIEHDVRRLDRLVSDISNASRLDSELVKEQEEEFDLVHTVSDLCAYLTQQAAEKKVEFITDFPLLPVKVSGLEGRLAQVFVNLITNAISFCEAGDAIRVWVRQRDNRVLIVVEDTGPGIPEAALQNVFKRFYSDRPANHFGNNSGLGLSISKQIVEAHGGVIWAENIRPTSSDATSEPLGARFVVGLPI